MSKLVTKMNVYKHFNREWAVSETVGFVIIFGIIMTGIGIVTLYGYPALLEQQSNANIRNMEKSLIILQSDVNALTFKNVPYKETIMQASGGVLSVEKPPIPSVDNSFSIRIINTTLDESITFPSGAIKFVSDSADISILLQNGAVVKWQSEGSVMLSNPRWFIDTAPDGNKTMVITLIQVNSTESLAKSGICNVQLTGNTTHYSEYPITSNKYTVKIKPPIEYTKAWTNYFDYSLNMSQEGTSTTWLIDDIDRVVIKAWKTNIINL